MALSSHLQVLSEHGTILIQIMKWNAWVSTEIVQALTAMFVVFVISLSHHNLFWLSTELMLRLPMKLLSKRLLSLMPPPSSSQVLMETLEHHHKVNQWMQPLIFSMACNLRRRVTCSETRSQVTVVTTAESKLTTFSELLTRDPASTPLIVTDVFNSRRERPWSRPQNSCHPTPTLDSRETSE